MIRSAIRKLLGRSIRMQTSELAQPANQSLGLGRREFLRLMSGVLVEATFAPLATIITHGDHYINRKLGLAFARPKHWFYESMRDFSDLKEGSVVGYIEDSIDILADELGEDLPSLDSSNPLAVISKYDDGDAFNPSIVIYFSDLSYRTGNPESLLSTGLEVLDAMYSGSEVIGSVSPLAISNCPSARAKTRFLYESFGLDPIVVEMETYMIFTGFGQYNVQMFDSPETGQQATNEFKNFISSLRIA